MQFLGRDTVREGEHVHSVPSAVLNASSEDVSVSKVVIISNEVSTSALANCVAGIMHHHSVAVQCVLWPSLLHPLVLIGLLCEKFGMKSSE